jgi:ABC-type phosphate/phosphonate transport system substrate-binding protein
MAKSDLDKNLINQIKDVLINMHKDPDGKKILENIQLSNFEDANDQTFSIVDKFLKEFEMTFGELPK